MITDLIKLERPLIVLDVETTGFYPSRDRIIQLGLIRVDPSGEVKESSRLIDPEIPIPPATTKVHKITDADVQGKPKFRELAVNLGTHFANSDVCGFNVGFDLNFLREEFKRCHVVFKHGKVIDACKIFHKREPRTLTAAMSFFLNETHAEAHDALGDAKATLRVFRAQLLKYEDLPRTVDELHELFAKEEEDKRRTNIDKEGKFVWYQGEAICNFGKKHYGHSLKQIAIEDPDFYDWIGRSAFQADTKKIAADALMGKFPKQE